MAASGLVSESQGQEPRRFVVVLPGRAEPVEDTEGGSAPDAVVEVPDVVEVVAEEAETSEDPE